MITRFFLVDDGKCFAICESDPHQIAEVLKQKPLFEITGKNGGYSTWAEAEYDRQFRSQVRNTLPPLTKAS